MDGETMVIVAVGILETTRLLIRSKLAPVAVDFRTPRSPEELAQLLNTREYNVACVLLDSDYLEDRGQAALRTIRAVSRTVPVVVLSSEQDRNYYIGAIRWGVSSFIVKPYKDDAIRKKLLECHRAQSEKTVEMITFDLERYLLGEYHKAEKGRFGLSYMFATVVLDDPEEQGNVMSQAYYLNLLYETIRHLFWDTDAFIRLNSKYYLGVFPFCGQRNIETLMRKIAGSFGALRSSKKMPPYARLVTAFASYPEDGTKFLEVQRKLADRVRAKMGDMNFEWFI
jgi:DNA-binding NarL/FixJ family response regulator